MKNRVWLYDSSSIAAITPHFEDLFCMKNRVWLYDSSSIAAITHHFEDLFCMKNRVWLYDSSSIAAITPHFEDLSDIRVSDLRTVNMVVGVVAGLPASFIPCMEGQACCSAGHSWIWYHWMSWKNAYCLSGTQVRLRKRVQGSALHQQNGLHLTVLKSETLKSDTLKLDKSSK
jgi:hypothetical protein